MKSSDQVHVIKLEKKLSFLLLFLFTPPALHLNLSVSNVIFWKLTVNRWFFKSFCRWSFLLFGLGISIVGCVNKRILAIPLSLPHTHKYIRNCRINKTQSDKLMPINNVMKIRASVYSKAVFASSIKISFKIYFDLTVRLSKAYSSY